VNEIYVFYTENPLYHFQALAEDGTCLGQHESASEDSAKDEMNTPQKLECYARHYPNGYQLVWKGGPVDVDANPSDRREIIGNLDFIQASRDYEFRRALTILAVSKRSPQLS
jgi:hypothetical protein